MKFEFGVNFCLRFKFKLFLRFVHRNFRYSPSKLNFYALMEGHTETLKSEKVKNDKNSRYLD